MSVSRLRSIINSQRGASYANEYQVKFYFNGIENKDLKADLESVGLNSSRIDDMMFLCDEASLPGQFAATNEIDGLYVGRLMQYPNAKLYNDFSLSFIQSNQLDPTKFFDVWFYHMFPELQMNGSGEILDYLAPSKDIGMRSNATLVNFYDKTVCDKIEVKKVYKTKDGPSGGFSIGCYLYNAYPYSIESMPLAYGASTLNKLRVQFRYEKHHIFYQ
jgi:hypothetical protein